MATPGYVGPDRRRPTAASGAGGDAASIRVPEERVDRLINLVEELVITQSMVAQTLADFTVDKLTRLREAVGQMDRHARQLHERSAPSSGASPAWSATSPLPPASTSCWTCRARNTELDKTVIEKIGDPLTHLVRNSVHHGIESPEGRQAAGKPESGVMRLDAYQQGGSIYIEVSDDGRGISR